jgi:polysaccharide biosynthesis protein PslG
VSWCARRIAAVVASALFITTLTTLPAPGQTTPPDPSPAFGVHFHAMWSDYTDAERLAVLDRMAAAGLKWVAVDFGWSSLQPVDGNSYAQWYVDRADFIVNEARARGLNVLMVFSRTPSWANGGGGVNVPPTNPADYGRAAYWVARHFQGRVGAWSVYNEPNHINKDFWTGTPADYARVLRAAYPQFKAGDPNALVVAGNVVYNDDVWLRQMYSAGAGGSFDVMGVHPYQGVSNEPPEAPDNGTKWRLTHVSAVHDLMCQYGDCDKPIWFTEFGWSSHPNEGDEGNWEWGVTEQEQAAYAVRAIALVKASYPYVTNMIWYNERTRTTGKPQIDNYGLLNRADLSEKPVLTALKGYLLEGNPPPPPPPPIKKKKKRNLLANASFELGTRGWRTNSRFYTVPDSVDQERSGKATGRNRVRITSYGVRTGGRQIFRAGGFIKSNRWRQVRFVILERIGDRAIKRKIRSRPATRGWSRLRPLEFVSSGRRNSRVSVRLRVNRPSRTWFKADKMWLKKA